MFLCPGPSQQPADIRTSLLDGKNNGGQQLKDPLAKRDSYASFEVRRGGGKGGEGEGREGRREGGIKKARGREGGRE